MNTKTHLLRPIDRYMHAINSHDPDAFQTCFDSDAVVTDVGREIRGVAEIMTWAHREIFAAKVTLDLMGVREIGGQTVLTVEIDGMFDRTGLPDPLVVEHCFTVAGDRIASPSVGRRAGDEQVSVWSRSGEKVWAEIKPH